MRGEKLGQTTRSRALRCAQTDAEKRLWYRLDNRQVAGCKFVRQEPIGRYFVDFVCRERRLVIELDGSQHADSEYDLARDAFLIERGYRVLRFWNNEAMINLDGVLDTILAALQSATPPHPVASPLDLSPQAGRGD